MVKKNISNTAKYCVRCGSKMSILENNGDLVSWVGFADGEVYRFPILHSKKTGKRYRIFRCPNWQFKESGFLRWAETNEHDNYMEGVSNMAWGEN